MAADAGEQAMRRSFLFVASAGAASLLAVAILTASPEPRLTGQPQPVFNGSQAATGATVYAASCASCHMSDLAGRNEAPQLAGNNFINTWRTRSTKDLFEFIQSTMPPTGENLSAAQYLAVTAYILQANGAPAGDASLTATTAVPIGTAATGIVTLNATPPAAAGRGAAAAAGVAAG